MTPPKWSFRKLLAVTAAILSLVIIVPVVHLIATALRDSSSPLPAPPSGYLDDASRLNQTAVADSIELSPELPETERILAAVLERAQQSRTSVSIGGARHSMGGHTLNEGGIYIDTTKFDAMALDEERNLLHVQSGARWSQIVPFLHQRRRAVAIMQTNNDFSVGGSISVNAHGWQHNRPPLGSSVEAFRLMLADGSVVYCSRAENQDLFRHVIGGYGLFGIILDVWLHVVPNNLYRSEHDVVPLAELPDAWAAMVAERNAQMLYARLSVDPGAIFEEAIVTAYVPADGDVSTEPIAKPPHPWLSRMIFLGSAENQFGKRLRWWAEKIAGGESAGVQTRTALQNYPVALFENRDPARTAILHEYFVPKSKFVDFAREAARIVGAHDVDLLNVTVRSVDRDDDSFLRYADQDMFALVMLFNQERSYAAETSMSACARALIDAALVQGGRYYLPYRLHATTAQFARAYPQSVEFFEAKRRWDRDEIFRNKFYDVYGAVTGIADSHSDPSRPLR